MDQGNDTQAGTSGVSTAGTSGASTAGTSGASTAGTDVVSRILLGLQTMQNELKSVRQGQDETARMVRESQIESARIIAKGKKLAYTFKKGNEIQSAFIEKVTEQVASATARMERVTAADESGAAHLARAKEDLEEGIKLLSRRQKMIKFADRSDLGWAVVEEYEDDALALNSEDERKMEKAKRAAERKVAKKRKLKKSKTREEAAKKGGLRPSMEPVMAFAPVKPPMAPKLMVPKPSGGCFHCGDLGHFRRECPKALASVPYPLSNVSEGLMAGDSICGRGKNVTYSGGECMILLPVKVREGTAGVGRCRRVMRVHFL